MNQILRSPWNVLWIFAIGLTLCSASVLADEANVSTAVFYVA